MLLHYLTEYQTLGYIIVFLGMMIEGDILLFTVGFLAYRGYFDIGAILLILFFGVIIGDNLWYFLGELIGGKDNFFIRFIKRVTMPFDEHIKNHTARTIFIAKFAYGLYHPMLLKAGSLRLSFGKFFKSDIIVNILWIFLVGGLGYISGASFALIKHYLRYTELTLILAIIIFILISHIVSAISKKEL